MKSSVVRSSVAAVLLFGFLSAAAAQSTWTEVTVHSAALSKNLLGDSPDRHVSIYLPPEYSQHPDQRYPVVYLLHGFGGTNRAWDVARPVIESAISSHAVRPMIVVMPDGSNRYGGSFYTDSATTGDWERFIVSELVTYVDRTYRTIATAASRGIVGHSMGGFGALRLAMKHPDVFGAVYALSPCCLGWAGDFTLQNPAWRRTLGFRSLADFDQVRLSLNANNPDPNWREKFYSFAFVALGAAWSPDPAQRPFFEDLPVELRGDALTPIDNVAAEWSANMPVAIVSQYHSNLQQLRGIAFDVGRQDEFSHITLLAPELSRELKAQGIQHTFEEYEGDHGNKVRERIGSKVLPFFDRVLVFASAQGNAAANRK